jgi:hypothetical protein
MRAILFLAAALLLSGCQEELSVMCPALARYSAEFQHQAAADTDRAIKDNPRARDTIGVLVADYGKLRDACRALNKK